MARQCKMRRKVGSPRVLLTGFNSCIAASAALAEELQGRDITADDYDILLQLDRPSQHESLYLYLTQTLPCAPSVLDNCVYCPSDTEVASVVLLPCGHTSHAQCLMGELAHDVTVPCRKCNSVVFSGLRHRLPSEPIATTQGNQPNAWKQTLTSS